MSVRTSKMTFTLHARFKLKEFEVKASAVLNGAVSNACGTVQAGDKTAAGTVSTVAKWGESVALTATPKPGYSFSGWYTNPDCTQPYTGDYKNNPLTTVIKANTTVYAKFEVEQKRDIYLQVPNEWKTYDDGAKTSSIAVYMWQGGKSHWFDMTLVEGNVYKAEITNESDYNWISCENYIFVKMKATSDNSYDSNNKWNNKLVQTKDINSRDSGCNCYVITSSGDTDQASGKWATYPFASYEVVLDAVSYDSAGSKETNGFTGGKVSVGGVVHTSAVTNTYPAQTTVTATAVCNEGYQFAGWFSDSDCINKVANNAELSISVNSSVHYYAKFVKSSTKVMYFVPNTNWTTNKNERFAAYVYEKSTGDGKWYSMTEDASHNCYTFAMDASGKYDRIIFSRMNGSTTENSWNNEWNRTPGTHGGNVEGIVIPTDGTNCFVQGTGNGGWDNCGGSWITK